jgi:hypothetical protein
MEKIAKSGYFKEIMSVVEVKKKHNMLKQNIFITIF